MKASAGDHRSPSRKQRADESRPYIGRRNARRQLECMVTRRPRSWSLSTGSEPCFIAAKVSVARHVLVVPSYDELRPLRFWAPSGRPGGRGAAHRRAERAGLAGAVHEANESVRQRPCGSLLMRLVLGRSVDHGPRVPGGTLLLIDRARAISCRGRDKPPCENQGSVTARPHTEGGCAPGIWARCDSPPQSSWQMAETDPTSCRLAPD
jgi:hypothetical protein